MSRISEWLHTWKLEVPQTVREVFSVFPIVAEHAPERDYVTLEEALHQGWVLIPETGTVERLRIHIKGAQTVLIPEGTILVGGWQNRVVNVSLLLAPNKAYEIPVSCVERRRWSPRRDRSCPSRRARTHEDEERPIRTSEEQVEEREEAADRFEVAEAVAPAQLRAEKLLAAFDGRDVQGEVWQAVSRRLARAETSSPTEDLTELYRRRRGSVEELVKPIGLVAGQVGALVAVGDRVLGLEVFDHPTTWREVRHRVLSGYAAEAIQDDWTTGTVLSLEEARRFVERTKAALREAQRVPAPVGLGEHAQLKAHHPGDPKGLALIHQERVIHLFAFPPEELDRNDFLRSRGRLRVIID
ncbi:MAG: hypothetical protein KatS3mg115_1721 [Candidatus Poribacteria bacterium]|nr:MAG: hypothetical protein KatS3mg115_1721 [Candidatus Poribacteria bacterium]